MNKLLTILLLLCINYVLGQNFKFPEIKKNGSSIKHFIPNNFKILDSVYGDLNKDSKPDIALVLESKDSIDILENDEIVRTKPRILAILFKEKETPNFKLMEQSNTFIMNHSDINMEEPLESIQIENGNLIIHFHIFYNIGSWYINNVSYEFQFMKNDFYLVKAKSDSFHRATHDFEEHKYDFLHKTWSFTKGNENSEKTKPITEHHQFKNIKLKTIKTLKSPFSWEVTKDVYL